VASDDFTRLLKRPAKIGPFMTSGAILAAARRTITCRHFGLHFASQVEPPYALCTVLCAFWYSKCAFNAHKQRWCATWVPPLPRDPWSLQPPLSASLRVITLLPTDERTYVRLIWTAPLRVKHLVFGLRLSSLRRYRALGSRGL